MRGWMGMCRILKYTPAARTAAHLGTVLGRVEQGGRRGLQELRVLDCVEQLEVGERDYAEASDEDFDGLCACEHCECSQRVERGDGAARGMAPRRAGGVRRAGHGE